MKIQSEKKHLNIPQLLFWLCKCTMNLLIFGRGTGKTEGPGAMFCLDNVLKMPRSRGAIICRSYMNGLEVIVPALIAGWERMGFREGEHFWCFKWPPEEFDIPKPHGKIPKKALHVISWYNGSIISLVSMDRPATANGLSADWMYIDEARLHNYQKIKELLPILRGNGEFFGTLTNHGSILLTTDRPRTSKEKWVLNFAKQMNKDLINGVLELQHQVYLLQGKLKKAESTEVDKIKKDIDYIKEQINKFTKGEVYVGYASTLENIHVLGIDYIKNLKRSLSKIDYQIQVLNKDVFKVDGGFYGAVPFDDIGYDATNYKIVDSIKSTSTKYDCTKDTDLIYNLPIHIACDYGATFNCVAAGQMKKTRNNILSSFFVFHPQLIQDAIQIFCDYYKPYQKTGMNTIIFHYDHTAVASYANTPTKYYEDVVNTLRSNGFKVIKRYMGKQPPHIYRYDWWAKMYSSSTRLLFPPFFINRNNNTKLLVSCQLAQIKRTSKGFEKDKSLEKDELADQSEATHLSDAFDTLAIGMFRYKTKPKGWVN